MSTPDPRIEVIFHEALDRAPADRAAFVREVCAGDELLQREMQRLLRAHEEAGAYFQPPYSPEIEAELARLKPEEEGERIGRFRLLQEIGEGGFGKVWMAEQIEPVQRRVALKIIKVGMDTHEVIARFEAERQALAMMDHPNIAKVFDAGATEQGRPFFVMELVKGIPITQFCDERQLETRERLALFADVCAAVNHAHQKGVIHRDIKPSNVMVMLDGNQAVPKVIDFGIAKATHGRLTDKTLLTRFEQFIGTPVYMSPEQAGLGGLDVDTRSDIYSLGVLLYELLTGKPPFDARSLASVGYEEMRRIIREVEPPKPSSRLSTVAGQERTAVARARRVEPERLSRLVESDLDWIVMRAIEKDRARRYETANGLALDIQRFLADEPVSATPPSVSYRFGKFARRHKLGLSAGAAVMTALVIGLIASLWQADRATRAEGEQTRLRARAETSQKKSEIEAAKAEASRGEAEAEAAKAAASELRAKNFLYAADMNLVQQALRANNVGRARLLLDRHRPARGDMDLRGWEWRYFWQQSRSGAQVMLTKREGVPIFSASFSPDGTQLVVGYSDGQVELWDVVARKLLRAIESTFNQRAHVAFSPQGENFAASLGQGAVKTVNITTGAETHLCTVKGFVRDLSYSRDGEWLAVLSRAPDRVVVLRAADGVVVMNYSLPVGGGMIFNNVRLSPDKQRLYVSCGAFYTPTVRCVSVPDARVVWENPIGLIEESETESESDIGFSAMDLSPDGRTLVLATGYRDHQIRVIDAGSGQLLRRLKGHTGYVLQVEFSADGRVLASSSEDETLRVWDTATWTRLTGPLRGHNHEVNAVAISGENHVVASGNKDGELLLWDTRVPRPADGRRSLPSHIQSAVALPIGRSVLGRTFDGEWSLIDLLTLAEQPLPASEMLPDGKRPGFVPKKHQRSPKRFEQAQLGLRGRLGASAVSPDGKLLVAVSESGEIGFYDAANLTKIEIVRSNLGSVFGVAFSPDSERLVLTSGGNHGIALWNVSTRQELLTLSSPDSLLSVVEFTDDGNTLLVSSKQQGRGTCQFWNAPSWNEIEAAERLGGRWPQTGSVQPPPPAPNLAELKTMLEVEYRERLAGARAQSEEEMERRDVTLENLAELLRHQHRDAAAEPLLRELLERLRVRVPRDDPAVLAATKKLLSVVLSRVLTERHGSATTNLASHTEQADALVADALANLMRQSVASPQLTLQSLTVALLQVWFGRSAEHAANSRRLIEEAERRTDNADAMERAAKAWCLTPSHDPALRERALHLAQAAAKLAEDHWHEAWCQHTLALVNYRSGDDREAEKALLRSVKAAEQFEGQERKYAPGLITSVRFIRSILLFRAGKEAEARELFAAAKAEMKPLPADDRQIFESAALLDDLLLWLSFKEARSFLQAEGSEVSAKRP